MERVSKTRRRRVLSHLACRVEIMPLEDRLPPGDTVVGGLLFGSPLLSATEWAGDDIGYVDERLIKLALRELIIAEEADSAVKVPVHEAWVTQLSAGKADEVPTRTNDRLMLVSLTAGMDDPLKIADPFESNLARLAPSVHESV